MVHSGIAGRLSSGGGQSHGGVLVLGGEVERKQCRGFRYLLSLIVGESLATSPALYLFFTIMAGDFLATMSLYIPYTHLPDMAISRGVDPAKAAFLISSAGISSTVGRVLAGLLCDQGLMHPLTITLVATLMASLQSFLLSRYNNLLVNSFLKKDK